MRNAIRLLSVLLLAIPLCAQTVDLSHLGTGIISLAGEWKFQPGDDPRWADSKFDDSGWKLVKVPMNLGQQGYHNFSGYGWYRLVLRGDQERVSQDLALAMGPEIGAYQIYVNGATIGRFGSFPPKEHVYPGRLLSFALPKARWSREKKLVVAVRYWRDPTYAWRNVGGLTSGPIEIGLPELIQNLVAAQKHYELLIRLPSAFVKSLELFLALGLIAIYLLDRRPEYLWFGLTFACDALGVILEWSTQDFFLLTSRQGGWFVNFVAAFWLVPAVVGIWSLLGGSVGRLLRTILLCYVVFCVYFCWAVQSRP